ncbi:MULTISPECIES: peptidase inhibitor family I36 protein [unclassified Streptomyces]|uniref:peptidase inhibitor family I36 protein n=1 Tax=unclassified Streptomyces TaxID=2593676 RepID=UPI00088D74CE|nr:MULTISPECIES: peptidase inhibitor family I36 protein [unclassified Streptomyces]PBC82208.1 peptidase inhibitor family I36 [Streptomyces sp. 2321.6]SDR50888.1 Peptidase inhibitor family I36 [Streptomyces sp. KS_16]SEC48142.1 Peptidase inhibitor family I36 [Streptomyces sp. 2133.1]SNC67767.1 Peptidase inhibitor family I36 [Streptomyces sp. 2114.4]
MRLRLRTSHTTALLTGLAALTAALAVPPALGTPAAHAAPGGRAGAASGPCAAGQLCLWPKADFGGTRRTYELSDTDIESCTPLPKGTSAAALANRTGRPVTTYQSEECAETAEFDTYPGGGSWVPRSPYQVRAFKVWER